MSVSGATDKTDYRISAMYADNQGNLATAYDGQKQLNLRLNYGIKLTNWFKLETAASMIKTNTSSPSCGLDNTLYGNEPPLFPAKTRMDSGMLIMDRWVTVSLQLLLRTVDVTTRRT